MSNGNIGFAPVVRPFEFTDKEKSINLYVRSMLNRTRRMFEYTGLPETMTARDIEMLLQSNGFAFVTKANNGNIYAFWGGLGGLLNAYYIPTEITISNPYVKLKDSPYKIDVDGVLVKNDTTITGLKPMFTRYATMMAENDASIRIACIHSRMPYILTAPDTPTREALQSVIKDFENGKMSVAVDDDIITDGVKTLPFGANTQSITNLIELQQYLKASWFNEIGLNANYNMKREAINSNESQLNEDSLLPLCEDMLQCRREAIEKINNMYGTNITVDFSSEWKRKEDNNAMVGDDNVKIDTQ